MVTKTKKKYKIVDIKVITKSNIMGAVYGVPTHCFEVGDILQGIKVTEAMRKEHPNLQSGYFFPSGGFIHSVYVTPNITKEDYNNFRKKVEKQFHEKIEEKAKIDKKLNSLAKTINYCRKMSKENS